MDEAIAWHLGLEEASAEEWQRFVTWLEAHPAHADAYDQVTLESAALEIGRLDHLLPARPEPARRAAPTRQWLRWGGYGGGLVAAAAAAVLALMPTMVSQSDSYTVETGAGARRTVTLPDGTRIEMNGTTRVVLDRKQPRVAMLESGEAVFRVVHHADRPFEVRTGQVTLRDVGTVFNVARSKDTLRVSVAEGAVLFQPDGEAVTLSRGMMLSSRDDDDAVHVSQVDPAAVGGWTSGRLEFHDAALSSVAEDVSRSTGAAVRISPEMAGRPFSGTLRLDRPSEDVVRSLAGLSGGEVRRDGPGWVIAPKSAGAR